MIRYDTTQADLEAAIETRVPGWLERAHERTHRFLAAGEYDEPSSIWSEIKSVYMGLQHEKCAYCERRLASADFGGGVEHDLEHFRPKRGVEAWPSKQESRERNVRFSFRTGKAFASGYYWLAYHPLNYSTACPKCNRPLKRNWFPVAAERPKQPMEPAELNENERPYLIYPLGSLDEDPEDLITFDGVIAIPKKRNGPRFRRAQVTIEFFELNQREELLRERAERLVALSNALAVLEDNPSEARKEAARQDIIRYRASSSPHASCVRSACERYLKDRTRAIELFEEARGFLESLSEQRG